MCLPVEEHTTTSSFANRLNLSLIEPLDLAVNLQKILGTENMSNCPVSKQSAKSKLSKTLQGKAQIYDK